MIIRNCSGGIVFYGDTVLLLENDKHEWFFPKGVIKPGKNLKETSVERVKIEAGIDAKILAPCGKTSYEFYSVKRMKPVHNNISWFIMTAENNEVKFDSAEDFIDGKFVTIEKAMDMITYSQDKSLLMMAYQKYKELI